ncbi:hypothetical protein D3C80_1810670 [compost metagenome]
MTSKLWLISSSREAGPLRSATREPLADLVAPALCPSGRAGLGVAACCSQGFDGSCAGSSCSNSSSSSPCLRRNEGSREPSEFITWSKRPLSAGGRSITGNW